MYYLHEPLIDNTDKKNISKTVESGWISSAGPMIEKFEKSLSIFTKSKYVVACSSGTSSLHIALKVLNLNKDDEVLVPSLTFVASINSIIYNNLSPFFIDNNKYYTLDTEKLLFFLKNNTKKIKIKNKIYLVNKITSKIIKVVMVVHTFGNAVDLDKILSFCKKYNITIIEDAAESLGTYYKKGKLKNKHTGTVGLIGCLSFNGNKIISTGGGGAILTSNRLIATKARYYINQAKDNGLFYIHNEIGYNYRLNNIQSSLGISQLSKIKKIMNSKQNINFFYKNYFKKFNLNISESPKYSFNNCWLNILEIDSNKSKNKLNKLIQNLEIAGIQTRPLWHPNHKQIPFKFYKNDNLNFLESTYLSRLCLPSSASLSYNDLKYICNKIINNLKKLNIK